MSLSASAATFTPGGTHVQPQHPQQQTVSHDSGHSGGRGRGRGGRGGNSSGSNNHRGGGNAHGGSRGHSEQQQRGGRGGRGGGRGGTHLRGGHHSAGAMSAADAAAIEAALQDDDRPVTARASPPSSAVTAADLTRSLLNFRFEPTRLQTERFVARPRSYPKGRAPESFNKKQYMQASHHFVLGGLGGDASAGASTTALAAFSQPDKEVDWSAVELVIVPVDGAERDCPICLSQASAAKITACGHVFCSTCILHYLSLSDRSWAKCPLCFDPVYAQALKSAEFRVHKKCQQTLHSHKCHCDKLVLMLFHRCALSDHDNDQVDFVLMRRYKDCVNASPVSVAALQQAQAASASSSATAAVAADSTAAAVAASSIVDECSFSRISLTTDISSILQREMRDLQSQRRIARASGDDFSLTYIELAEVSLCNRMDTWARTHPFWQMKEPTLQHMQQEEQREQQREEQEKARAKERAQSILAQSSAWPELKAASTVPPTQQPKGVSRSPSLTAAAKVTVAAAPTSANVTASPAPSSSPSVPSASPPRDSFFDDDEAALEHKFNKKAAATAAAAAAAGTGTGEIPRPIKPGQQPPQAQQPLPQSAAAAAAIPSDVYYFYQCADGQQLYLHSLPYRALLLEAGGSVAALPPLIRGRVAHMDSYVMDGLVRNKLRFLSHLPLTATFQLALVELSSLSPAVCKATLAALAPEVAQDKKQRQTAARKQKELNKRTLATSKAMQQANGSSSSSGSGLLQEADFDERAFPDLANPLGFASGSPSFIANNTTSGSPSLQASAASPELRGRAGSGQTGSPQTRVGNWNTVAEKGMASSELWAPLVSSSVATPPPAVSHWGSSATPLARTSAGGSHPPAFNLGSAGWGRKPNATTSNSAANDEPDVDSFPLPSVNRHGQTTLLSTAGRRSYK